MAVMMAAAGAFLLGSIPFALLVGYAAGGVDIRQYGDGNPGAANVIRALGWRWGVVAMLLDYLKGLVPAGLAFFIWRLDGAALVLVAAAPVAGHALMPWPGVQGGKAVAATFGLWTGLTLAVGPVLLGALLGLMFAVFAVSGWAVLLTLVSFGVFVLRAYPALLAVWLANFLIVAWTHRAELRQPPGLRPWVLKRIGRAA